PPGAPAALRPAEPVAGRRAGRARCLSVAPPDCPGGQRGQGAGQEADRPLPVYRAAPALAAARRASSVKIYMLESLSFGASRSLVAHWHGVQGAVSSNPAVPTSMIKGLQSLLCKPLFFCDPMGTPRGTPWVGRSRTGPTDRSHSSGPGR